MDGCHAWSLRDLRLACIHLEESENWFLQVSDFCGTLVD